MTNIAVIISADSYSGELSKLKACGRDSVAIQAMLRSKERFSDILVLHDEHTTAVNDKVFSFLKSYENKGVDEVFFYFSGHGEYHDDEFYFLMKDYRSSRRRQTSFINSELDDAVRAIRPRLYAKVVDACHSGISYVKNSDTIKGYLEKSKPPLKDLYFLFSSQHDQSSWQGDDLSDFTASIIRAACEHTGETLKYKDIINYVVDDFDVSGGQTPFFVNQGSFTDVFCYTTAELRNSLAKMLSRAPSAGTALVNAQKNSSISDLVRADASYYCTKEEALSVISSLPERFSNFELSDEFKDLYNIVVMPAEIDKLPSPDAIGSWLSVRKEGDKYLAEPISMKKPFFKRVLKPLNKLGAAAGLMHSLNSDDDYITTTEYRMTVVGYKNTAKLPVEVLLIGAKSNFPNIPEAFCFIAPIISRTTLRAFYAFAHYDWVDWDSRRLVGDVEWQSVEAAMKDEKSLDALVDQICAGYRAFVQDPIAVRYKPIAPETSATP